MIRSYYYKGERGNKPYDLELMLRLYLLQNLYNLSDENKLLLENCDRDMYREHYEKESLFIRELFQE